ncbi:MAG: hypothetical protein ACI9K2_007536 [Myxococcota bacterium]
MHRGRYFGVSAPASPLRCHVFPEPASDTVLEIVRREDLSRARVTLDEALPAAGYELHFRIAP